MQFFLKRKCHRINVHIFRECHIQTLEKIIVWAGISGSYTVASIYLDESLTSDLYLEIVENLNDPQILEIMSNIHDEFGNAVVFQQDSALQHFF